MWAIALRKPHKKTIFFMRFPRKEPLRAKNSAEAVRIQWIFPWSTTNGRFTTFVDWLMVLRVP
jgi:hypothetical protein